MVPLQKTQTRSNGVGPEFIRPDRRRPAVREAPSRPRLAHKFRIVDVMTRQQLVDGAGIAEALAALKGVRSVVDVNVYVWEQERARWRPMTFEEEHALFDLSVQQAA
jgi:hypothetical protein